MKNYYTIRIKNNLFIFALLFSIYSQAQDINFTFANTVNTTDGVNDFYETDVMIASTTDFILGSGLLYFNYNNAAFGTNISDGGTVEITYPSPDYICGEKDNAVGSIAVYGPFVQNDNTSSRFAFSFQQAFGSGSMAGNNVTSTPAKLFHLKIQYVDSAIDPMISFEGNPPFDDQFFTACGPLTSLTPADCSSEPGIQLLNDTFDSGGASLGVQDNQILNIKVFPNPAKSIINISSSFDIIKLELYNLLGQKILTSMETSQLNISNLNKGIYFLNLYSENGKATKKIIVE